MSGVRTRYFEVSVQLFSHCALNFFFNVYIWTILYFNLLLPRFILWIDFFYKIANNSLANISILFITIFIAYYSSSDLLWTPALDTRLSTVFNKIYFWNTNSKSSQTRLSLGQMVQYNLLIPHRCNHLQLLTGYRYLISLIKWNENSYKMMLYHYYCIVKSLGFLQNNRRKS